MNLHSLLQSEGLDPEALPFESEPAPSGRFEFEPLPAGTRLRAPSDFDKVFADAGAAFDVDPVILKSIAFAESGFDPDIISGKKRSRAGAIGLMQFMPDTAKEYDNLDPTNPVQSIFAAAQYMRKSLDKFGGDYGKAVASYNHGPNRDTYNREDWDQRVPPETQKYLMTVFDAAGRFKDGQAERGLPQGVTPSKAGAGRGSVNPTLDAPVTDTGDETARLAARYKAPDAPQQGGFIHSVGDFFKPAPTSVLESYKPTAAEQQAANTQRLRYGAGPIKGDVLVAANEVASGNANSSSPTVNAVAKQMQERGDTFTGYAQSKNTPILKEGARDAKAAEFRSAGEWAVDSVSALAQGSVSIPLLPASILAPGGDTAKTLRSWRDAWSEQESDVLKAQRVVLKERIQSEEGFAGKYASTVLELVTNPALGLSEAIKQVPNYLAVIGASRIAAGAVGAGFNAIEKSSPTLALANALSSGAVKGGAQATAATAGGMAASVVMTSGDAAGDVYETLTDPNKTPKKVWEQNEDYQALIKQGLSHKAAVMQIAEAKARFAAVVVAPLGLFGFMGAESALATKGIAGLAASFGPKAAAKTFGKEIVGENIEEGGTKWGGNVVTSTVDPRVKWDEGVAEAAATATVTSAPMAGLAARSQLSAPPAQTQDPRNGLIAAGLLDPQTYDGGIVGAAGTANPLLEQLKRKPAPTVESQPTTPQVPPTVAPTTPVTPNAAKTQAVDNIAAAIKELEGGTTQAAPVQPGSQAADTGTTTVAQGTADSGGGLASAGAVDVAGQSESAQSLTDAPSRLRRIEALNTERSAIARQLEAQGQSIGDDPLGKAIQAATSPLATRDADWLLEALTYSEQTNRTDIAQEVKLRLTELADKLEAESVTDSVTPGVATDNPKYETIAANLRARRESKGLTADAIRARLKSQQAGALTVPEKGSAVIPSVETGQSMVQRLLQPASPEQEQAHADTVVAEKAKPAPAYTPAMPQPGQAEAIVGKAVESARKNADLADERMYSVDALQRIAAHPQADAELKAAATNEVQRRAGIEQVKQQQFEARRSGTLLSVPDAPPLRPLSVERGIEIAKASRERKLLPQEQGYMDALKSEIGDKAFDLVTRAGKAPFMTTMTERKFDLPRLLEQNNSALTQWDTAHNPAQKPTAAPKAAPTPAPAPTGIGAEMTALKARSQPAASQQAQPQIFTGKSALFDGYGASVGSVEAGDRKQLMVDPNGGYFWGDWKQESQRDVGAVAGGADKDATPASFTSSKEARQAAASTPLQAVKGKAAPVVNQQMTTEAPAAPVAKQGKAAKQAPVVAGKIDTSRQGFSSQTTEVMNQKDSSVAAPDTDARFSPNSDIAKSMPTFKGNKRKMLAMAVSAIKRGMNAPAINQIDDWFGGGGMWSTSLANATLPNVKRIRIAELNPLRIKRIQWMHARGDKLLDDMHRTGALAVYRKIVADLQTENIVSPSPFGDITLELAGFSDKEGSIGRQRAQKSGAFELSEEGKVLLSVLGDLAFGNRGAKIHNQTRLAAPDGQTVDAFLAKAAFEMGEAKKAAQAFKNRGGVYEYFPAGSSYDLVPSNAQQGENVLSLADPPYYNTTGYKGAGAFSTGDKWNANGYAETAKLLKTLVDRGNHVLYTDEAWWLRPDQMEDRNEADATLSEINQTIGNLIVAPEQVGNRYEQLGIHNPRTAVRRSVAAPAGQSQTGGRDGNTANRAGGGNTGYAGSEVQGNTNNGQRTGRGVSDTAGQVAGRTGEQGRGTAGTTDAGIKASRAPSSVSRHAELLREWLRGMPDAIDRIIRRNRDANKFDYELRDVPVADITPSQSGEDYLNDSSRETARQIATTKSIEDIGRKEDVLPIVLDENLNIIDGNHRHAASKLNGAKTIPALVRVGAGSGRIQGVEAWMDGVQVAGMKASRTAGAPQTGLTADKITKPIWLWHGSAGAYFSEFNTPIVFLTDDRSNASAFASDTVLNKGSAAQQRLYKVKVQPGDIRDIQGAVDDALLGEDDVDVDTIIQQEAERAAAEGVPYVSFMHPGVDGPDFRAIVTADKSKLSIQGWVPVKQSMTQPAAPRTQASTIRTAITKAYGNLLPRLEGKGLVTLTQTEEEAIAAAAQARADQNGGDVEVIKAQLRASVLASQRAWHGTPHRGIEKFSTDKIGTGEGAQAFGYGLYFADRRELGDWYMGKLSKKTVSVPGGAQNKVEQDVLNSLIDTANTTEYGGGKDAVMSALRSLARSENTERKKAANDILSRSGFLGGLIKVESTGQLYEVDIPNDSDMLLWDKPLSEQPESVQNALKRNTPLGGAKAPWKLTGAQFYQSMARGNSSGFPQIQDDRQASEYLASLGIKGIKYLDGTSRNAGEGSYNYVVFSGEDVQIVDVKYSKDGNLEGFFDPATGKSFLIADNLTAESAPATLMHEVGIHRAAEGGGKMGAVIERAGGILRIERNNEFVQRVQSRMDEAGETSNEEAAAYIVTEYEKDRTNAPASVKQWIKDFIADVRAWLFNKGVLLKADQLTVADIAAVARANASRMARGDGRTGDGAVRNSKQPTPDKREQTETPEFKRWFAGSQVVDADGKPLVVYHGSLSFDGAAFDQDKLGSRTGASSAKKGFFFTSSADVANSYAEVIDDPFMSAFSFGLDDDGSIEAETPSVTPAFLSIQNPLVHDFKGSSYRDASYSDLIDAALEEGRDGVVLKNTVDNVGSGVNPIVGDVYVAFNPTQIKSAIGNNGDFDGNNPDIRRSVRGGGQQQLFPQQAVTTWDDLGDSKVDSLIYEGQDDRIDLKRVQENIAKAGRQVREEFDARMAETLFPGRVAKRNESFVDHEVKPLLQAMSASNVSMEELGDYLLARHAPERNAQIAKVNPGMPDGGAGTNSQGVLMTTQAAQDHIANLSAGKRTALQLLARQVDAITKGTREMLVTEGLEKASTVAAWEGAYQNYVPLFKDEAAETPGHPVGSGFSVKGGASKRAMGSTKEVTNVLAHVLMQREAAITRAEKNRVAMSLYGLALTNPNKAFWGTVVPKMSTPEIIAELQNMGVSVADAFAGMEATPTIRYVDPNTGLVTERPNPVYKNLDNALVVKVDGEDRVILFNKNNARAMRLAESLKNQNRGTGVFVEGTNLVAPVTRFMASMLTQYNPAFGMVNAVRDIQGALVNLSSTPLKGKQAKVLADVPAALKGIARDVSGNVNRTQWSDLWVQFQEDGGRTGIRDLVSDPYEKAGQIEKDLKRLESAGKLTPGNAAHAVLDLLSGFNDTLENGVRVAAYKAALDQGMSRPAAAKLARELTVDFNRKGRTGRELGKLYAFLNASVQGSARTIQTLKGPMGAKIMAGGFAIGVLQAFMLAAAGFDDDDIPEFIKSRNLIIPMGGDRYVTIPMALGLHVLPNTGRAVTELVMSGGKDIGTKSLNTLVEIVTSFNPFGGGGDWKSAHGPLTMVTPTVMDPVIDMAMNRDFTGRQISKERRNPGDVRPGATLARESTKKSPSGQVYIGLSELINKATLGTDVTKGAWSPTPEELRYMATVVGGGVYRETERAVNAAVLLARGEEVKPHQVPLGSRFAGTLDEEMSTMSRYYKNDEALNKFWSEFKAEAKDGNTERVAEMRKDPRYTAAAMNSKIEQHISKLNKLAGENVGDKAKYEALNQKRAELMRKVNEAVKEAESK